MLTMWKEGEAECKSLVPQPMNSSECGKFLLAYYQLRTEVGNETPESET
jgi:hypothetical protein